MSLTALIRSSSPLKEWFGHRYPNVKFMQAAWRSLGPPDVIAPPGANPSTVGTAFDYRLRFFFDAQPDVQSLIAHTGAIELDSHIRDAVVINLDGDRQAHSKRWDMLADFISRSLLVFGPRGAEPTPELEMAFARVCCLLARLDVPARVANKLAWGDDLVALGPDASIEPHMVQTTPQRGSGGLGSL